MFLRFRTQTERREYGGTDFVELQFCKIQDHTSTAELLEEDRLEFWKEDSLYVEDYETFRTVYGPIFSEGLRQDMTRGTMDIYGVTYYLPGQIEDILEKLSEEQPEDYEILQEWLIQARAFHGIYILGI